METFKIEHFMTARGGIPFPWYRSLTPTETASIRNRLADRLATNSATNETDLVSALAERRRLAFGVNAQDSEFNLAQIMDAEFVQPDDLVYVNWYRFDEVDQLKATDLARYFDDIWYPSSDDIDVFDQSLSWMISVSHEGRVYAVDLAEGKQGQ